MGTAVDPVKLVWMGACGDLAEPTVDAVRLFDFAGMTSQEAQGLWDLFGSGETGQDGQAAASVVFPIGNDHSRVNPRLKLFVVH